MDDVPYIYHVPLIPYTFFLSPPIISLVSQHLSFLRSYLPHISASLFFAFFDINELAIDIVIATDEVVHCDHQSK